MASARNTSRANEPAAPPLWPARRIERRHAARQSAFPLVAAARVAIIAPSPGTHHESLASPRQGKCAQQSPSTQSVDRRPARPVERLRAFRRHPAECNYRHFGPRAELMKQIGAKRSEEQTYELTSLMRIS